MSDKELGGMMSEEDMGKIAHKVLAHQWRERGMPIGESADRELGNLAKSIGIETKELRLFCRTLGMEIVDSVFG